ncbi:GNAT family N-acetyltransferase [Microbacterium sp. ARD32]|uniref:GNAT family N-acetyltransferase n=1 Tax=Microbacterium sp. ARD32 TaxID=2962577 RepID=UPI002882928C|nr:GNAT family N-acetyltransferase [Microbacterium sp. ARD32]MDT0157154.1 GNAT family N-acetyltransferase [Microbacterium sp. ARD32]
MPAFPDAILHAGADLTLSGLIADDAPRFVDVFSDSDLRRWLPLPSPYTLDMATQWCTTISDQLREEGRGFVLGVREADELVGSVDAKRVDWLSRTAELSYWTAPDRRGRGIMPTAVRRVAEWMLAELAFERIELRIAPANTASLRAAEKAGFRREGTARNAGFTDSGRVDLVVFSLIRPDIGS